MGDIRPNKGYFANIAYAAKSILEGMSVTLSHLVRKPITTQYPDKLDRLVSEMLPDRYRGFLEVDMDICTACMACERACPIDCIKIDVEGKGKERYMTRFDIDMAKCMYCGLCVDPCPTNAIRMTKEFEASTTDLSTLVFRFVPPGEQAHPFKPKKGEDAPPTVEKGLIARKVRDEARVFNPGWILLAQQRKAETGGGARKEAAKGAVGDWLAQVQARVEALKKKFETREVPVLFREIREALADTDCGACDWPTCDEYAQALADGRDKNHTKCEPGGEETTREVDVILKVWRGEPVVVGTVAESVKAAEQAAASSPAP